MNLSQLELAERTGLSVQSIHRIEQGDVTPRASNLRKLATALGVTVTYLMNEGETDKQKDSDKERFIANAHSKYGAKGAREAIKLLEKTTALFAGGELDDESKLLFVQSIEEIYFESKAIASQKFTPKNRKRLSQPAESNTSSQTVPPGVDE